jgi:hypothetical protein
VRTALLVYDRLRLNGVCEELALLQVLLYLLAVNEDTNLVSRGHGGKRVRPADGDDPQNRAGLGAHAPGGDNAFRVAVLGVLASVLGVGTSAARCASAWQNPAQEHNLAVGQHEAQLGSTYRGKIATGGGSVVPGTIRRVDPSAAKSRADTAKRSSNFPVDAGMNG